MTFRSAHLLALVALVMTGGMGPAFAQTTTDYDRDNDNYIEVSNHQQLHAIRQDLDGNGFSDEGFNDSVYNAAFPGVFWLLGTGIGCPSTCVGYELTADIDLDTNGNGVVGTADTTDAYYNSGAGWLPIATGESTQQRYQGRFKGNGYTIQNLYINRGTTQRVGLFGNVTYQSRIESLGVTNANVTGGLGTGILAGESQGTIVACYTTGSVTSSSNNVGGLVGMQNGSEAVINSSYSTASVSGSSTAGGYGGLLGHRLQGTIKNSYSIGSVTGPQGGNFIGGLIGGGGSISTVFNSYWNTQTSNRSWSAGGTGKTTAELQNPTGYTGIYANWLADVTGDRLPENLWNFGTSSQYPTLINPSQRVIDYDGDNDGLIDVNSLDQLNAIRHDLNGDGAPTDTLAYALAFLGGQLAGSASTRMGCTSGCTGYELMANLDFDENGDGSITSADTTYWNSGLGWQPIGTNNAEYTATFEGNGKTISNLYINHNRNYSGFFGGTSSTARIRSLGLVNATIARGQGTVGALVGLNKGRIAASYVTGSVTANTNVGGLVGATQTGSYIVASYSTAPVVCNQVGPYSTGSGLVGGNGSGATIASSYSTGTVTGACTYKYGLTANSGTVTASYWDTQESNIADDSDTAAPEGKTVAELQSVTSAQGIYAAWDDLTIDASGTNNDDPWTFGSTRQYPVLKFAGMDTAAQFAAQPVHYDTDSDGLINVSSLAQLNAMRWDLNGDGAIDASATTNDTTAYNAAFPNGHLSRSKGCPSSSGCTGYELMNNLDFDENNDGAITSADPTYWNSGAGWLPLGAYSGTFKGNNRTISNLYINRGSTHDVGLFRSVDGDVSGLGLVNVNVTGNDRVGGLSSGQGLGSTISSCYVTGRVSGARYGVGGLVGRSYAASGTNRIVSSYAIVSVRVPASVTAGGMAGGLVGWLTNQTEVVASYAMGSVFAGHSSAVGGGLVGQLASGGSVTASYATGPVTGAGTKGGLVGSTAGTVADSYWDTKTSGIADDSDNAAPEGKTPTELQSPTAYGTTANGDLYANWNANLDGQAGGDDPWTFGTATQYPALKYDGMDTAVQFAKQPVTVTLTLMPASISENGGTSTVTATLARSSSAATTITVRPVAGAYTVGSDSTITIAAGSTADASDTVVITAVNNTQDEPDRSVTVSAVAISGQVSGSVNDATLTLEDDDSAPTATLAAFPASISENTVQSAITATLSNPSSAITTITVRPVSGAYTVGADSTITIAAGSTANASDTVIIISVNNTQDEPNRSVTVLGVARNAQGAVSVTGVSLTLEDDDDAPEVTMAVSPASISEAGEVSTVTATLNRPSSAITTITVRPVANAYTVGSDSTIVIAAGQTTNASDNVVITTLDNSITSGNRTVTVSVMPSNSHGVGTVNHATLTITDDDVAQVTLVLDPTSMTENGQVSTITATLDRTATAPTTITVSAMAVSPAVAGDFTLSTATTLTIAANATTSTGTVTITSVNDTTDAPDKRVTVSGTLAVGNLASAPSDVTLTITDDEAAPTVALTLSPASISEASGVSTITATLSHKSSEATTITVRPVSGAYTVGSDSTIAIAAGNTANASDTVEITAVNNMIHAADNAVTVSVAVSNDHGEGSVTGTALMITEDEAAPEVTMAVSPVSISETGEVSTVTATLNRPSSSATTIAVSVTPVTPAVAGDYSLSTQNTLTVAVGQTTSTGSVTITTVDNQVATGNKTVTVSASAVDNSVGTGTVNDATLTIGDDDVARVTLLLYPASIPENGQVSTITATLDRTATAPTTITVSATPVSPAVAGDFTLSTPTTLTIAASATTTTDSVTITSVNDTTDAPDKRVTVSATVTGGNMASLSTPVTLTITDDDAAPTVTLASDPASISEASGVSTIRATLSHKSSAITTITVRPVSGAYTVGSDATIAIAAGSTANATDTVVITAVNNTRDEPDRAVTVTGVASNTQGAGSVTGAALTLQDDDPAPDVTLSVSPQSFSENGGVARVSATLSHPSSAATTVTVTAVANVYTVGSANTIIIAANATTSTDGVTITAEDNDRDAEDNATTVTGTMTNSQGTGSVTGASVTITDDDAPPMLSISSPSAVESNALTFRVTLNKASGKEITVAYADASTGSATSGTDYTALAAGTLTFAAGETSETLAVSVTDDAVDEPNETVAVTLSNAVNATFDGGATSLTGTGTIIDNDGMPALSIGSPSAIEGATGATLSFRVYLSPAHTSQVTVAYADARTGSATAGADYTAFAAGTLTFAIGATEQTLDVSVIDDSIDEPHETVAVRLSSAVNAIFDGGGATLTGTGTIIDDDAVMLRIDSPSVAEGAPGTTTPLRFTVSLSSANASQVRVAYTDAGTGSATAGTDYAALAGGTLIFAAGETRKPIDVSVIGDAAVEPNETVVIMLSNAVNGALAVATGTGTITNDDQAPTEPEPEPEPEQDPNTVPTFTEAVDPQSYPQGNEIDPLILPAAIDGNGTVTYSLTGLPEGLSFDVETRTVSGTPTESVEKAIYTLTVTDEDGDAAEVSFFLTISANLIPSFGDASVDAQALMRKQAIESLTLPQATGGDAPLTYALTPDLPAGLRFNAETRVLSGTPLEAMDETTYTLTATDSDGDEATLTFTLSVTTDPLPIFSDTTIAAQGYQHQAFTPLTLPQATGGDAPLTYALNPDPPLPEGLSFDGETLTVSGTPLKAMDEMTYTLTATDGNGDAVHFMFTLEVPDLMPTFGDTTIAAQSYLVNQEIESLTFPQASSGDGMLVYILLPSLPDGISFDPTTRTLSGMPTAEKTLATYTLSALDTDGDVASLPFTLEVSLPSPDLDGDGVVNFADFLTFADKFGSRLGQERYDARCDLNGDGEIGFADFLIFAAAFGSSG